MRRGIVFFVGMVLLNGCSSGVDPYTEPPPDFPEGYDPGGGDGSGDGGGHATPDDPDGSGSGGDSSGTPSNDPVGTDTGGVDTGGGSVDTGTGGGTVDTGSGPDPQPDSDSEWGIDPPPRLTNGTLGRTTRYWDCCKLHCSWRDNVFHGNPTPSCSIDNRSHGGDYNRQSRCSGGDAYVCYNLSPWSVGDRLSYGFAAVPATGDVCGKCYQLDFLTHPLSDKTMIVQAINIGYDVSGGQFDLQIPGGGVGQFNACSAQWNVGDAQLGAQYGGFLTSCQQQLGNTATRTQLKTCVRQRCDAVFNSSGREALRAGCYWFVDWFEVTNNPGVMYREVSCPAALQSRSGMYR